MSFIFVEAIGFDKGSTIGFLGITLFVETILLCPISSLFLKGWFEEILHVVFSFVLLLSILGLSVSWLLSILKGFIFIFTDASETFISCFGFSEFSSFFPEFSLEKN